MRHETHVSEPYKLSSLRQSILQYMPLDVSACHIPLVFYFVYDTVMNYCIELDVLKLEFSRCCGKSTTQTLSSSTRYVKK